MMGIHARSSRLHSPEHGCDLLFRSAAELGVVSVLKNPNGCTHKKEESSGGAPHLPREWLQEGPST